MTKEERFEYNKLCASFIGYGKPASDKDFYFVQSIDNDCDFPLPAMLELNFEHSFCENWRWIMIVVEKIEATYHDFHGHFGVYINSNSCTIQGTKLRTNPENPHYAYFTEFVEPTKKEAVVKAIYSFLKWYKNECSTN